jgi:serine/threonine-protein kinase
MSDPSCFTEADLRAFLLGEVPEDLGQAIRNHLEGCPACEEAARRLDVLSNSAIRGLRRAFPASLDPRRTSPHLPESPSPWASDLPRIHLREPQAEASPRLQAPSAALPAQAGRCAILGEIARGGMGAVLKGHDPDLGRDLAIKVLLDKYQDQPDRVRRFLVEAQVGGQLQHPGIVPVYDLGMLLDRRPFFTMKLVQGQTLASLLAERPIAAGVEPAKPGSGPGGLADSSHPPLTDLPRFLKIFEQVCQTMAYAHARGVIHRDLKPDNVMVGAFGEVQVMDWGLAKMLDLASRGRQPPEQSGGGSDAGMASQAGSVVGTPAYMAPEQARGETERLDERCDVFGLGAILCEILTGQPPFVARSHRDVFRQAEQGQLTDAYSRLDACGADGDLVRLAKGCLAVQAEDRPRDGGILAREMTAYLAGVQERLRAAEVERAAAQAKAEEARAKAAAERRARRLTLGMTAAGLAVVLLIGGGWLWIKLERDAQAAAKALKAAQTAEGVNGALLDGSQMLGQSRWRDALVACERAESLLAGGDADEVLQQRVQELRADLTMIRSLENTLLQQTAVSHGRYNVASADANYAAAFRRYGVDVLVLETAAAATKLQARAIRVELASALDHWAILRRNYLKDENGYRRLLAVARAMDPDPWRNRLREAWEQRDRKVPVELARSAEVDQLPSPTLILLGWALRASDARAAVNFLRQAQLQHLGDFWINHQLGWYLSELRPPEWPEALRFFMAAAALQPNSAGARTNFARALLETGDLDRAKAAFEAALHLDPNLAEVHDGLGIIHGEKGEWGQAVAEFQKAIAMQKDLDEAWTNLGHALEKTGTLDDALAAYTESIRLRPKDPFNHRYLGDVLGSKGELEAAIEAYKESIRLSGEPAETNHHQGQFLKVGDVKNRTSPERGLAETYYNLGYAYHLLGKDREAIRAWKESIRTDPKYALAHCNLGMALAQEGALLEALAIAKRGHELIDAKDPNKTAAANGVRQIEHLIELDGRLDKVLHGEEKVSSSELVEFAQLCKFKKLNASAARLYRDLFMAETGLAQDLQAGHRYNAACAAVLAGLGQGGDASTVDEKARTVWRKQALEWLRADMVQWTKQMQSDSKQGGIDVRQMLQHWQHDGDLVGIRDAVAVAKLPQAEQKAWRKLWVEVESLLAQTRSTK